MAIGKPSLKTRIDTSRERAEEAIISRAGARPVGRPKVDIKSQPTVIRFKPELLARIDEMAQRFGTAIIVVTHDEKIIPTFRRIYHIRDGRTVETAGEARAA